MKMNIVIITMMIISSMAMVGAADIGTFEVDDTIGDVALDLTVDYDADRIPCFGTKYNGEFDIGGTLDVYDTTYDAEFDDSVGQIWINGDNLKRLDLDVDGKLYQNGEYQYLYKDNDNRYYGYIESGFYVNGELYYQDRVQYHGGEYSTYDGIIDEYTKYVITRSKPIGHFTTSSPALGLRYKGSVAGDYIPELFTYRDTRTWKQVVSETYPTGNHGPVTITPARIAGEPLIDTGFWDTPKGQRILEWQAAS